MSGRMNYSKRFSHAAFKGVSPQWRMEYDIKLNARQILRRSIQHRKWIDQRRKDLGLPRVDWDAVDEKQRLRRAISRANQNPKPVTLAPVPPSRIPAQ